MKTFILALLTFCAIPANAAYSPAYYGNPFPYIDGGGVRLAKSDTTTTCNAAASGSIRNNAGTLQGCNGSAWASFGAGAAATLALDNLVSVRINTDLTFAYASPIIRSGPDVTGFNNGEYGTLLGSNSVDGSAGSWSVTGGSASGVGSGGSVYINGGSTSGLGTGGDVTLYSGRSSGGGANGNLYLDIPSKGTQGQTIVSNSTSGRAVWGPLNLAGTSTVSGALPPANGGTGLATLTNHAVQVGAATSNVTQVGPSASTVFPLVSGGSSADPAYALLTVPGGGTGLATLTSHAIQVGNATGTPTQLGLGTSTQVLHGAAAGDPTWGSVVGADIASATIDLTTKVTGALPAVNGGVNDPDQITNCSIGVTVASSAVTFTLLDGAGAALSATSPCIISFRNATAATGTFTQVTTTAAVTVVGANADSLGCPTAAVQCMLSVYAINNAGTVVLGVFWGGDLDEGSVQTGTALTGGADTARYTLWSTAAQASKAVRLLSRVTITPAAAFAWTNAVTEISPRPSVKIPWIVQAKVTGNTFNLSTSSQASYVDVTATGGSLVPSSFSAPAGVMCATTNAATAPSTGTTTCGAGNADVGISFAIPSPGIYLACYQSAIYIVMNAAAASYQYSFDINETPTNAQTITVAGQTSLGYVIGGASSAQLSTSITLSACASFDWTKAAAGTIKGLRLMYESSLSAAPTAQQILCDAGLGNRTCAWTITRVSP